MTKRVISLAVTVLFFVGIILSFAGCAAPPDFLYVTQGTYKNGNDVIKVTVKQKGLENKDPQTGSVKEYYTNDYWVNISGTVKLNNKAKETLTFDRGYRWLSSGETSSWFDLGTTPSGTVVQVKVKYIAKTKDKKGATRKGEATIVIQAFNGGKGVTVETA